MAELPPPWSEFMATVEGRADARPIAVVDSLPALAAGPAVRKPMPNLALLSALLRGGTPLPPEMQAWLADLFDPEGAGLMRVARLVKRGDGPMPGRALPHSAAVERVRSALDEGKHLKAAFDKGLEGAAFGRTTLWKAIDDQEAAEEEHARAARED